MYFRCLPVLVLAAAALPLAHADTGVQDNGADAEPTQNNTLAFVTSLSFQEKNLHFDQTYHGGKIDGRSATFNAFLPTLNGSLTTSYRKLFATLKYERSMHGGSTNVHETPDATATHVYYLNIPGGSTDVDRQDLSLTVGYNVWSSLNLFIGYMEGKTRLTPQPGCGFSKPDIGCLDSSAKPTPTGTLNLALDHQYDGWPRYRQTYEEKGPYVGASYSWQIGNVGSLSLSAAYADMNGEYRDNYQDVVNQNFKYTGDSTGTSLGLTWTAPLGDNTNYFIDVRRQHYSMDAKDANGNFAGVSVKTNETMKGVTAGIQAYF